MVYGIGTVNFLSFRTLKWHNVIPEVPKLVKILERIARN